MKVTREEMKAARIPLQWRDYCAHLLIPLNECRKQTWYSPFKCQDLRHGYEKCQYDECVAARRARSAPTAALLRGACVRAVHKARRHLGGAEAGRSGGGVDAAAVTPIGRGGCCARRLRAFAGGTTVDEGGGQHRRRGVHGLQPGKSRALFSPPCGRENIGPVFGPLISPGPTHHSIIAAPGVAPVCGARRETADATVRRANCNWSGFRLVAPGLVLLIVASPCEETVQSRSVPISVTPCEQQVKRRCVADVFHPDHAPPPGKTDTHFT
eukprot:4229809-Prymnesium_polylepis.1